MLDDDIIEIIKQGIIDQQVLREKLIALGHDLTQSRISRKLKSMGVVKIRGKYQIAKFEEKKVKDIVFTAPNMFVIRTIPGHAASIAAVIDDTLVDNPDYPHFLGTIAGDDTIFVAIDLGSTNFPELTKQLRQFIS